MTFAVAIIGGLGLLSGLLAIFLAYNAMCEDSGAGGLAAGLIGAFFGIVSWLLILTLFVLSFITNTATVAKVLGGAALCLPLIPIRFLALARPNEILLSWGFGWLSSTAFYILFLAL